MTNNVSTELVMTVSGLSRTSKDKHILIRPSKDQQGLAVILAGTCHLYGF